MVIQFDQAALLAISNICYIHWKAILKVYMFFCCMWYSNFFCCQSTPPNKVSGEDENLKYQLMVDYKIIE